ncbi:MAG: putative Zn-dependent protease [Salibacteraceae bacterium]|jgi:predicted Zn-dependent protease
MTKYVAYVLLFVLFGCASVPISHRKQLNVVNESELITSSRESYQSFLDENLVISAYNPNAVLVKRVGEKLALACKAFLEKHGDIGRLDGFNWEFNLVEGSDLNAWCMPGGKVVVYEGILAITEDEQGLAVVLSHEIAHAIARHGNERVSQQMLAQYSGAALVSIFEQTAFQGIELQEIISQIYGAGAQLGLLKFSRVHETEADKMGLVFMEYAGYDSENAIAFWQRMLKQSEGVPSEFLSTHPSDQKRIRDIETFIPVAKSYVN